MTLLFLARHGETADNAKRVFQGQAGRGLDVRGRAQAARLAERMSRAGLTALVSSDLERAVETARTVASVVGLEVQHDRDLREVDVGTWTGKSYDEVADLYPEEWAAWSAGLDLRRGGGETYAELAERVDRALARVADAHAGGRVLVVSHGGAIRSWVVHHLGLSAERVRGLSAIGNAALCVIERAARGWILRAYNDEAHLEGLVVDERSD